MSEDNEKEVKLELESEARKHGVELDRRKKVKTLEKELTEAKKYKLPKGKSITTVRGMVHGPAVIFPENLPGGQDAIQAFLKSGHLTKD